ncbi:beta-xylosidase [Breznakibacter xylanolyticus]|uniref:Beta-xylosidase n=1 Tax=Breznakibacter xylanolyticus TaxID=990 RepID=A0A2W7N0U7_9BACT|nr:glycoside hydrolase 43 family protein [Breznakibacter xylanolyticus]PZX13700.1 beta-xylosidase [Breznakibacter xylanolyticus]
MMRITQLFATAMLMAAGAAQAQQPYVSKVWVADKGNGTYQNPILYADYSDPDVCRAGDDYYMVSSSFNCVPALQILHSKDMVNWSLVGAAAPDGLKYESVFDKPQHGNGMWAPSIRYHQGEFFIYVGDPDFGILMTKAKKAEGPWSPLAMVKAGKGLIDPCPLWDEDGRAYVSHAFAGSRAGLKSVLAVFEMTPDGTQAISESRIVFDGHEKHETVEGTKFHKKDGYYYILAPAGGVKPGWQLAMRSKNVYGPYEEKIVLAQGKTAINGPHQGAWVETPGGEHWFFHFQDVNAYGRIVHLQPMTWKDGWPVMGVDKDGDGCGEPVLSHRKPNVGATYPVCTPLESDEFDGISLGWQWQWHANPQPTWVFNAGHKGYARLFSVPLAADYKNLWNVPNLLMQKFPAPEFSATTKVTFTPSSKFTGERAGLVVMGFNYGGLFVENTPAGLVLTQADCAKADKGTPEKVNATVNLKDGNLWLKVSVAKEGVCTYSYSTDGKKYQSLGNTFTAREGRWIGAKVGLFVTRPQFSNDGGWMDVDWFRIDK